MEEKVIYPFSQGKKENSVNKEKNLPKKREKIKSSLLNSFLMRFNKVVQGAAPLRPS